MFYVRFRRNLFQELFEIFRPTSRGSGGNNQNSNGVALPVGLADDQAKDFDFEKTEMKYDSTGMFHWGPAKNLEDCILVRHDFYDDTQGNHILRRIFLEFIFYLARVPYPTHEIIMRRELHQKSMILIDSDKLFLIYL